MKIDGHLEALKEVFLALDTCIDKGIENFQRTIGFQTSLGAVEMFELYLHRRSLFSLSARINHSWLKSQRKMRDKFDFEFPRKQEIIELLYYIEKNRDELCYGKKVEPPRIEEQLEYFNRLRDIMREVGLDEV
jgi:hypothetical protein